MLSKLFSRKNVVKDTSGSRPVVAKYARGNISLQQGKYTTKQQADNRKKAILKHSFV